jgi:hypothetical protein
MRLDGRRITSPALVAIVAALALAGCGGSSRHAKTTETIPVLGLGGYSSTTETVPPASPALCRRDAQTYTDAALAILAHTGPTPADLYYYDARLPLADFQAHHCDPKTLGAALAHGLTVSQQRSFVAGLPSKTARLVENALAHARG